MQVSSQELLILVLILPMPVWEKVMGPMEKGKVQLVKVMGKILMAEGLSYYNGMVRNYIACLNADGFVYSFR